MPKMILIIRPQPYANRDVALLKRYGVPALASPSMKGMQLHCKLPNYKGFSGIIMTSRNAVEAFVTSGHIAAWAKMPVFVVGAASAAAARDAGFLDIIIGTGGGAGLMSSIRRHISNRIGMQGIDNLPLFWPSAEEISFDMVAALAAHEIAVQRLRVYQMVANDELDSVTREKIDKEEVAAVVAMSSRSILIFQKNLNAAGKGSSRGDMTLIAGSAAIAAAAGNGWQMVYVARQPRRSRLLAIAVLRHQRGH